MKSTKIAYVVGLATLFLMAGSFGSRAQAADPPKADSSNVKQTDKKSPDGAATPKKNSAANSHAAATPASAPALKSTTAQQPPPAKAAGMVWVNTESGVYHKPGTRWYGKTKQGKLTEADAIKAGYKAAGKD